MLHTLHDGSRLITMSAKGLIRIPIWKGNRILDMDHVKKIKEGVGKDVRKLEFCYTVAKIIEEDAAGKPIEAHYIIDGQHRHRVISDYFQENLCEPDFPVIVLEKQVISERDIITKFNELNTQKPIDWKSDPVLLANDYIFQLCMTFNTKKETFLRGSATKRPYLSTEALRNEFVACSDLMSDSPEEVKAFIQRVVAYNTREVANAPMAIVHATKLNAGILQKAAAHNFMLAVNLSWIRKCLMRG